MVEIHNTAKTFNSLSRIQVSWYNHLGFIKLGSPTCRTLLPLAQMISLFGHFYSVPEASLVGITCSPFTKANLTSECFHVTTWGPSIQNIRLWEEGETVGNIMESSHRIIISREELILPKEQTNYTEKEWDKLIDKWLWEFGMG